MRWLKKVSARPAVDGARPSGWFRRAPSGRFVDADGDRVVTTRNYPAGVTSRTIRGDVYEGALRAAETTLRNTTRKK
jgi:hypothetical protein